NAAARILLLQFDDFAVDGLGDLLGDHPPRVPGEITEQRCGEQRKQEKVHQRQTKRRGADQFTEGRHVSCTRRREWCAGAAPPAPCRSSSAAVRYARRSRWSADRSGSPTRFRAAWCASPPG